MVKNDALLIRMLLRYHTILPFILFNLLVVSKVQSQDISDVAFPGAVTGVSVIDLYSGDELFSHNHSQLMIPASVFKLVTTAAVLEQSGADFRYRTGFYTTGQIHEGTLNGDLVVQGGADGTLGSFYFPSTHPDKILEIIGEQLKKNGIETIDGRIILDESIIPLPRFPAGRLWEDMANYYGAAPSGISWRDNSFELVLRSPVQTGMQCQIVGVFPPLPGIHFKSFLYSASHSKDSAYIFGYPGLREWEVRGSIPAGRTSFTIKGAIPEPGIIFADELRGLLQNGQLTKVSSVTQSPYYLKYEPIFVIESPPLSEIIRVINQRSHNMLADHLFLTLGYGGGDMHQLWDRASWSLQRFWNDTGLEDPVRFHDGSGLSPKNLVTPGYITSILEYMHHSSNAFYFESSLAVSGESGTLSRIWNQSSHRGKVVAKSGYMQGVLCYAGYIYTNNGRKLAFSVMVNHFTQSPTEVRRGIEQFIGYFIDNY